MARSQLFYKDLLQAIVVVKGTFEVAEDGTVRVSDSPVPVVLEDTETTFGSVDAEVVPAKAWCDLAVFGCARSLSPDAPVTESMVDLRIGSFTRQLRIFGPRVWTNAGGRLRASAPAAFTELPLTYTLAYGGEAVPDAAPASACFENPWGRGYVPSRRHAEGTPLPCIEEVDQPLRSWSDRPLPAGVAPLPRASSLRAQRGVHVDVERRSTRLDTEAFCFAHPRMTLPEYPAGAEVSIRGMTTGAPWLASLPGFDYEVEVTLGDSRYRVPVTADTLYLLVDERRVIVLGRSYFIYQMKPERLRNATIMQRTPSTGSASTTTIRQARADARPELPIAIACSPDLPIDLSPLIAAHPLIDLIETAPLCPSS